MRLRSGLIGEEIDGEVVMIDLGTGVYYSLRGGGVLAWRQLSVGTTREGLVDALGAAYDVERDALDAAVDGFLAALRTDELLVDGDDNAAEVPRASGVDRRPFEPLEFERFDDMAHVIQLDPVHDIDPARGWPLQVD